MSYVFPPPPHTRSPVKGRPSGSPCTASTASAATTPRTRARWGRTRIASRRSSSPSRRTRSWRTARAFRIRRAPRNFHHEIELVVAIGKGGARHPGGQALDSLRLRGRHRPHAARPADPTRKTTAGRGTRARASTAPRRSARSAGGAVGHLRAAAIWLKVNGKSAAGAKLPSMIWNVPEIIAELSTLFELQPAISSIPARRPASGR